MRKPRLNENTMEKIEIYGYAKSGNNYYELRDYIDAEGNYYTQLEHTNIKTGETKAYDWAKFTKEA